MSRRGARLRAWLLPDDWAERIQLWLAMLLQLAIAGVLVGAVLEGHWLVAFTAAVVLVLTFAPAIIARRFNVYLPVELTLINCLFLYAAFGLGEVREFYRRFWWWDLMLHSISALVMGLIGFLLIYVFYSARRVHMAPVFVALISFGFALTLGTLWEIAEFVLDWAFGFTMQKSGLTDTMTDLMVNALGGLAAAWIGYQYVRGGDSLIAERLVRRFVDKNPRLFRPRPQQRA
ncbi:MAG: hypothetical protein GWO16_10155 [Gammaproteobacteria bacterium]|nr:hypothetical protein [Gammaproteobacteria bacterium]NIR98888.1 hypothetical protein [Gammaproteobacteria bacterium]NIT64009.1 hypothetical protein [Gammaproteobacteria bacterium]NIV19169.1 hypothetical protein [Gammaproteobacteria bacterium]NIX10338.1 hypothetical protein [Gammaproteobacteria bacterium]